MKITKMANHAWEIVGVIVGGYAIYQKLLTLNQAKNDFYSSLSPDHQVLWDEYFGKPNLTTIQTTGLPPIPVTASSTSPVPSTLLNISKLLPKDTTTVSTATAPIDQVKAGT